VPAVPLAGRYTRARAHTHTWHRRLTRVGYVSSRTRGEGRRREWEWGGGGGGGAGAGAGAGQAAAAAGYVCQWFSVPPRYAICDAAEPPQSTPIVELKILSLRHLHHVA